MGRSSLASYSSFALVCADSWHSVRRPQCRSIWWRPLASRDRLSVPQWTRGSGDELAVSEWPHKCPPHGDACANCRNGCEGESWSHVEFGALQHDRSERIRGGHRDQEASHVFVPIR